MTRCAACQRRLTPVRTDGELGLVGHADDCPHRTKLDDHPNAAAVLELARGAPRPQGR